MKSHLDQARTHSREQLRSLRSAQPSIRAGFPKYPSLERNETPDDWITSKHLMS